MIGIVPISEFVKELWKRINVLRLVGVFRNL